MDYSNKFCFIQKKEEAWIVSMYQREGNAAKLIKEISTSSEGEARKAQKEFFQ
jgi:hypothetical protein